MRLNEINTTKRALITEGWNDPRLTLLETTHLIPFITSIENYIVEANLTPQQINQMFTDVEAGATAAGVVVALDRQEKGNTELSAIQEIEKEFSIPVISIINLQQIIDYLEQEQDETLGAYLESMKAYQSQYGI